MSRRVAHLLRSVADLVDPPPRAETHDSAPITSPPKADLDPEQVQHAREIAQQLEDIADAFGHGRRFGGVRIHT